MPERIQVEDYYKSHYSLENGSQRTKSPALISRMNEFVDHFEEFNNGVGSILEIGFGDGFLLEQAALRGWSCSGTEFAPAAITFAQANGWNGHSGDLRAGVLSGPFDIIVLIETVEHLLNPSEVVAAAFDRLRPGGMVIGTTPNGSGINSRLLSTKWSVMTWPDHVCLFSQNGLHQLLDAQGFVKTRTSTRGFNPYDIALFIKSRGRSSTGQGRTDFGVSLNENLQSHPSGRFTKTQVNRLMHVSGWGDTIEFQAFKPTENS